MKRQIKFALSVIGLTAAMIGFNNMRLLDSSGGVFSSNIVNSAAEIDIRSSFYLMDSDNKDLLGSDRGVTIFIPNSGNLSFHSYYFYALGMQLLKSNPNYKSSYFKMDTRGIYVGPFFNMTMRDHYYETSGLNYFADLNKGFTINFSGQATHVFVDMLKALPYSTYLSRLGSDGDLIETFTSGDYLPEAKYNQLKCVLVSNSSSGVKVIKSSACDIISKPYSESINVYSVVNMNGSSGLIKGRFSMEPVIFNRFSPPNSRQARLYVGSQLMFDPLLRRISENFGNYDSLYNYQHLVIPEVGNQSIVHTGLSSVANSDKTKPFKLSSSSVIKDHYASPIEWSLLNDPRTKSIEINGDKQLLVEIKSSSILAFGLSQVLVRIKCYSSSASATGRSCRIDVEQM